MSAHQCTDQHLRSTYQVGIGAGLDVCGGGGVVRFSTIDPLVRLSHLFYKFHPTLGHQFFFVLSPNDEE